MSYNNNVFKFDIGDLVERITWDAHAKKLGVVVAIGEEVRHRRGYGPMIKVCWADNYGTFWCEPSKLKLIAKGNKNV